MPSPGSGATEDTFLPSRVLSKAGTINLQIKDSSDRDGEKVTAVLQLGRSLQIAAEERGGCWGAHAPLSPLGYRTPVSIPSWLCTAVPVVLAVRLHAYQHPKMIPPAWLPLSSLLFAHWDRWECESCPGPCRQGHGGCLRARRCATWQ